MWMLYHLQGIITIKASYFYGLTQAIVSPFAIQFTRQILIYRWGYYTILLKISQSFGHKEKIKFFLKWHYGGCLYYTRILIIYLQKNY